jgi:uncharacterized protein (TIGR03083 family)
VRERKTLTAVLGHDEIMAGTTQERAAVVTLIGSLTDEEVTQPTRCVGWTVGDVAAHLAGLFSDVAFGRFEGQGTPAVTARQVADRRGRTPTALARELAKAGTITDSIVAGFAPEAWSLPAPGGFPGPLRRAVQVLWYDLYVHGDDIRAALGWASDRGPGLRAAIVHVAETLALWGWGPATLHLDGIEPVLIRGGGPAVTGDAVVFLLAATGRVAPTTLGLDERVNIYR